MTLLRINKNPSRRQLFVFGLSWLIVFGCISLRLSHKGLHPWAVGLGALTIIVPVVGLVWVEGLRLVYIGLTYATYPIGFVVSHVVLAVIYYLVLSPIGLVMKIIGYDPLARRLSSKSTSYWQPRENAKSPDSYFRQI